MIDTIMPGASPYVLRGIANDYFPGNIADRVSVGNFLPGTGIGLAMVHKAVERMDGRIWAESTPGQGASFYLELPR